MMDVEIIALAALMGIVLIIEVTVRLERKRQREQRRLEASWRRKKAEDMARLEAYFGRRPS